MSNAGPLGGTIDEADPVKEFAVRLRQLQTESGGPSVRDLESLTRTIGIPYTRSTIQDKLAGRTAPDWTFVAAYVRACALRNGASGEPDLGTWRDWHQQMLRDIAARRAGQRRAGEAARALGIGPDSGPAGAAPVGRAYRIVEFTPDPVPLPRQRLLSRQPSWLLAARHRVVPFIGRIAELAELARWRDDPWPGLSVMLVHGTGGQGKTRLADEFARHTAELGSWAVRVGTHQTAARPRPRQARVTSAAGDESVAAPARRDPVSGALAAEAAETAGGVLLVVDYAERWPTADLLGLIDEQLMAGRVRVLLLARPAGLWWDALRSRLGEDFAVDTETLLVEPLAADLSERVEVFVAARDRFAEELGMTGADGIGVPANLAEDGFGLTLAVHMAALVAVDAYARGATAPTDPTGLVIYLLDREREHWQRLHAIPHQRQEDQDPAHLATPPQVMARAVYLATLTRPVGHEAGRRVLTRTRPASDQTVTIDEILADHARCYPPADSATVLEPLYPDRLGEDYLALSTPGHPHTYPTDPWTADGVLTRLLTGDDPEHVPVWAGPAVTVLVEATHRWPHLGTRYLYPLLRSHPRLALAAGGATLIRLAALPDLDPTVLATIEATAPERHINLDVGLAAVALRLAEHPITDPAARAALQTRLDIRLANAGQHRPALAANQEAVEIYRRLADSNPAAYLPDLARSLSNLGVWLSELGRREDALAPSQEAVTIRRRLAEANPAAHLPDLATSLNNLGLDLSELGRREDALAPSQEALTINRRLAEANPAAYLPNLAMSLNNLGLTLSELGRREDSLAPSQEALTIYRRLAETNPAAYLPNLALSLNNTGSMLSALGRREEALAPSQEAVIIYRRLAEANPAAYLPNLALSLKNLGVILSALGRREEALALCQEAVTINRRLVEANPAKHLPDLAASLSNLGLWLWALGRRKDALALSQEALTINRRLVEANPAKHLPDLAASLNNIGVILSGLGRRKDALASSQEALTIYRRLVEANPAKHLPDLAASLNNIGVILSGLGRRKDALVSSQEALTINRRLAETNPAAHLPELAKSLGGYASARVKVGLELPEALAAVQEAIGIYRPLAYQLPEVFGAQLRSAFHTLADVLNSLGRSEEAAELRRWLAQHG